MYFEKQLWCRLIARSKYGLGGIRGGQKFLSLNPSSCLQILFININYSINLVITILQPWMERPCLGLMCSRIWQCATHVPGLIYRPKYPDIRLPGHWPYLSTPDWSWGTLFLFSTKNPWPGKEWDSHIGCAELPSLVIRFSLCLRPNFQPISIFALLSPDRLSSTSPYPCWHRVHSCVVRIIPFNTALWYTTHHPASAHTIWHPMCTIAHHSRVTAHHVEREFYALYVSRFGEKGTKRINDLYGLDIITECLKYVRVRETSDSSKTIIFPRRVIASESCSECRIRRGHQNVFQWPRVRKE